MVKRTQRDEVPEELNDEVLAGYKPPGEAEMQALLGDVQHNVDVMEARFHREPDEDLDDGYDLDDEDDETDEELRRERDLGYTAHGEDGDGEWQEGYDY
ncbi:MAG: hypothetical protein II007_14680 [Gammaproteobacteria bacterium]|nr:hypothetical protein [Gammaproteobacteria bacterium]